MKKIVIGLFLLLVICSTAVAAPLLSEFPMGMSLNDAKTKGLIMRDNIGGILSISFGDKVWPAALVFENEKLVHLILKGAGSEFIAASDDGLLWQLSWLIIYSATDRNLVFDAVKLASSGMSDEAISEEYGKFLDIVQSQKFVNSVSVYVSERVWATFKQLRNENPVDVYPDATLCNVTTDGNDITLVFSTFGYISRMNKQTSSGNKTNDVTTETQKNPASPGAKDNKKAAPAPRNKK